MLNTKLGILVHWSAMETQEHKSIIPCRCEWFGFDVRLDVVIHTEPENLRPFFPKPTRLEPLT